MVFLKYSANFSFSEAAYRGLPYLNQSEKVGSVDGVSRIEEFKVLSLALGKRTLNCWTYIPLNKV